MDLEYIIDRVRKAGIVGAGGGGFPTWQKLNCKGKVDTLILNGAECEPLMYSDYYCMLLEGDKVLHAASIVGKSLGVKRIVIAFKKKHNKLIEYFEKRITHYGNISMHLLEDLYPAGDEHVLTYSVANRIVPQGGIPLQVGVIVQNVQTIAQIWDSLSDKVVTHRYVTVGGAVKRPYVLKVPIGTPLKYLIERCGGVTCSPPNYLVGGVMMGELAEDDFTVEKTTTGIVVLPLDNQAIQERLQSVEKAVKVSSSVCDQCFACTEMCPRYMLGHDIQPHILMRRVAQVMNFPREEDHIGLYCCECGLCSLIACPVKITPRRIISNMKKVIPADFKKSKAEYKTIPGYERKAIPMSYVKMRLGLERYDKFPEFRGDNEVSEVKIKLDESSRGKVRPMVSVGFNVNCGDLIAEGEKTIFHSSINGKICSVGKYITVRSE